MQKQFVNYEIALKLKELGFDEECFGYFTPMKTWMMEGNEFNSEPHFHGCNWPNDNNTFYFMYIPNTFGDRTESIKNSQFTKSIENVAVPLWQQVIDWFDTKGVFITIKPYYNNTVLKYGWLLDYETFITGDNFNSRYEAIENVIITAIELYEITLKEIENYENNNNT